MKTPIFTGANVAIVTPFKNGAVDFDSLKKLIEFQIENGTNAITICGTTGESPTLSHEEHTAVIKCCVETVAGRVPVIAGTGSNDTNYALYLSKEAEDLGVDGLLMVTPYYNKASQIGLIKHYTYVADRVNTPIILYNVPGRTGVGFTAATYKELSKHPNINGIKEASGNFTLFAQTLSLCGDDMNIWSGNDDQTVPMMALGAKGVISVASNVIPADMVKMCNLALAGDFKGATEIQLRAFDLMDRLFVEVNPIPVKAAVEMLGLCGGELRMPLWEISDANRDLLKKAMVEYGLSVK
ncbi:MAG: 4-hydroxy-tetrahydrodipicolinate synthase [Ruminococcaceae bacterium]|nr:4-hydroxy-tetrahydrodipicolinate synthase [Oscillospiraceae bacterium]